MSLFPAIHSTTDPLAEPVWEVPMSVTLEFAAHFKAFLAGLTGDTLGRGQAKVRVISRRIQARVRVISRRITTRVRVMSRRIKARVRVIRRRITTRVRVMSRRIQVISRIR